MADEVIYTIATKLTALCQPLGSFYLSEAETEDFPYAVYDATYERAYAKDGVYKETGDVTIHVVSNDFDEADELSDDLQTAIATGMNSDGFTSMFVDLNKGCVEGIWTIDIRYTITKR